MLLRANVLAKGFSGIRPETLELLVAMLNAGVHPGGALAGQRRARAAISLPWLISPSPSSAKVPAPSRAARSRGAEALAAAGPAAGGARGQGRAGPHQRDPAHDGGGRARRRRSVAARAHGRRDGRAHPRRAPGHGRRVRPADPRRAPPSRPGRLRAQPAQAARRQPHPRVASRLRQGAGRLHPALHAPGARRRAGRPRVRHPHLVDRAQRRHRQPDGVRGVRRDALRRELPRRAGGHRRRRPGHRDGRARQHQRAADRAPREPRAVRPARVPHRRGRDPSPD